MKTMNTHCIIANSQILLTVDKLDWIKNIDFTATRTYYVSCFSKSVNSNHMQLHQ